MKKRIVSCLLVAGLVVGLMTGCGKGGSKKKGSGDGATLTVGIPQNAN